MTTAAVDRDAYRRSFERSTASTAPDEPSWLRERRTSALDRFVERGFPGPREEAWRHTPIAPITRTRWEPADPAAPVESVRPGGSSPFAAGEALEAILVGGRLLRDSSRLGAVPSGVEILGLREALATSPDRLAPHLGRTTGEHASVFADLSTAFATDGVVVFVSPGTILDEPIHVLHLAVGDGAASRVSYPRLLVVAGRGSECRIVETYAGPEDVVHLTNAVTEIVVEDNAFVDRYKLQREAERSFHVANLAVRLGRDGRFADHSFSFGAAISRNDIEARFEAEGGECVLDGLFVVDGSRLADTHSRIDHAQPHCSSRELYKGVLDGAARGVFNGLLIVRPGAQQTDAWQMNRNLLLSREALVHSTPQLEILADDVKCRHGSTTGQLDPAALFYLRSRGIGEAEARSLLTLAFASDLVQPVPIEPLRRALAAEIRAHLPVPPSIQEALT